MCFKTVRPNPMPRKVAMALPNMPARIPGTIRECHPFAVAIPLAVVGPPTLAFEAISSNFKSSPKSLPSPRITARWITNWTNENRKILGAVFMTFHMLPVAPITAKNTYFSQMPKTSCHFILIWIGYIYGLLVKSIAVHKHWRYHCWETSQMVK